MNRKHFLSTLGAIAAAPFVKTEKPKNELPRDRQVEVEDVEKFVRQEISFHLKGQDIWAVLNKYKNRQL